jgi:uncharacterized membrane protein YtjA (UPF0391 family)
MATLLGLAVLFLVVAFVAYVFGAKGVAGFSMSLAKVFVVVFVILFVATLLASTVSTA